MVKKHILVISLVGLACAALLGYCFTVWFSGQEGRNGPGFTVLTCNIGIENCGSVPPKKLEEISQWVLDVGRPDILLLQEFMGGVEVEDLAARLGYRYCVSGRYLSSRTAQVILSDFPLSEADDLDFNSYNKGDAAVSAVAEVYGKRVLVCTLHLTTLRPKLDQDGNGSYTLKSLFKVTADEIFGETEHLQSTRRLLTWLKGKNWDAAVVGGDFNTVFLAKSIRLMTDAFDDALWPSMEYFHGTKTSKSGLPIIPRIDYIFHTEQLSVKSAAVLPQHIGDHLPVMAEIRIAD
ncbi:MAG: hypothetical protein D4R88_09050 [Methanosarcinales archaeon]|nr:MAG: hypothetical protein D4R88_09050 [Methanosarcinales archaeon]